MYAQVSPWPPQSNGIADYARALVRSNGRPTRLVTEALRPDLAEGRVAICSETTFLADAKEPSLYQVGNNPHHAFLIPLFLRKPGVAILHDPSLQYLAECFDRTAPGFVRSQIEARGAPADKVLRYWRAGVKSAADHLEFRCLDWLRDARAIIVHSQFVKRIVEFDLPDVPVHVVPHFAYPAPRNLREAPRKAALRARFNLRNDQLVIVAFGFVKANKQYDSVIRAIARLPARLRKKTRFVVAGALDPDDFDLPAVIERLGAGFVELLGYLSAEDASDLLAAADLVVNLRYPTFGESSGAVARAHGAGAAVVVSDGGSFAELPDNACFKVPYKADVSAELAELFGAIAENPRVAAEIGERAQDYAVREISPARCGRRIDEIVLS